MLTDSLSSVYGDNTSEDIKHINDIIFSTIKVVSRDYVKNTLTKIGKSIIRETIDNINHDSLEERLKRAFPEKTEKKHIIVKLRDKFDSASSINDLILLATFIKSQEIRITNEDLGRKILSEFVMTFSRINSCDEIISIVKMNYDDFELADYKSFIRKTKSSILDYDSDVLIRVKLLDALKLLDVISELMLNEV